MPRPCPPLLAALLLLAPVAARAVPGVRTYTAQGSSPQVALLPDGGLVVGSSVAGAGPRLLCVDSEGATLWEREILPSTEFVRDMGAQPDGRIRILVSRVGGFGKLFDVAPDGTSLGGLSIDGAGDGNLDGGVLPQPDGGWSLPLLTSPLATTAMATHFTLTRVDSSGAVVQQSTRNLNPGGSNWSSTSWLRASDGRILGGGFMFPRVSPHQEPWVIAHDAAGAWLWERSWGDGAGVGTLHGLSEAPGGGTYVATSFSGRPALLHLDAAGELTWAQRSEVPLTGYATVVTAANGDALFAAQVRDPVALRWRPWVARFAPDGTLRWQAAHHLDARNESPTWAVAEAVNGEIVLTGRDFGELVVVRLTADGEIPGCPEISRPDYAFADFTPIVTTTLTSDGVLPLTFSPLAWTPGALSSAVTTACEPIVPTPPDEVSPRGAAQPLVFTSHDDFHWEDGALSGSTSFDVHRGELAELRSRRYGACLISRLASPSHADATPAPASGAWFYLVVGRNDAGLGPMGFDSFGVARPSDTPCP